MSKPILALGAIAATITAAWALYERKMIDMHASINRLQARIGRRGTFLLLVGAAWIFIGASVATDKNVPNPGDAILYQYLPVEIRGAMWAVCGIIAICCSLRPSWEKIGFVALVVMALQRVVGNVYGFIHFLIPGYPPGAMRSLWNVLAWGTIGLTIYVVAGWDDDVEAGCE